MRIAVIAPPFLPVPPCKYGGTELFIAQLAAGLLARGHDLTVYANGESRLACDVRSRYARAEWPLRSAGGGTLKSIEHLAWSLQDAAAEAFDVIHLNDAIGIPFSRFVATPVVHTLHHPHDEELSALYDAYPDVSYVAISRFQAALERMPRRVVIHHGIDTAAYGFSAQKEPYAAFLGRLAPCKGAHLAIEAARRADVPLKIAGEIQPTFRDYWESQVRPHVDGRQIEYLGEADHALKNGLLCGARALLFPIQWDEPFGLVMIEAMACGTPVLALPGGSVPEIVRDGVSGWICPTVEAMAERLRTLDLDPAACRQYVERRFTLDAMVGRYEDVYRRAAGGASIRELVTYAGEPPPPVLTDA
jgi:glycosyltransferase involved in cell wall biosynthesis